MPFPRYGPQVGELVGPGIYIPDGWGTFWNAALAKAQTSPARLMFLGDSVTKGYFASSLKSKSLPGLARAALQNQYGDGGSGFFSPSDNSPFATTASIPAGAITAYLANGDYSPVTGVWASGLGAGTGPGGGASLTTTAAAATATFAGRGTTMKIYTISNGGANAAWQYSIDGGGTVNIADGAGYNIQTTTITGLAAGTHSVVITYNDVTKTLYIVGVDFLNASGVVVHNHANYGMAASVPASAAGPANGLIPDWCGGFQRPADCVVIALDVIDAQGGVAPLTHIQYLRQIVSQIKDFGPNTGGTPNAKTTTVGAVDVVFLIQHVGAFDNATPVYQAYVALVHSLAESYGAAVMDSWELGRNSWNYWNSLSYWASNTPGVAGTQPVHLVDAGYAAQWAALSKILAL